MNKIDLEPQPLKIADHPQRLLQAGYLTDVALLILRVWVGATLFLRHGLDKFLAHSDAIAHFPDPFHLGTQISFAVAMVSDSICSLLVVVGLATRWSALFILGNIFVAWATVVHFQFFSHGVSAGEPMVLYLGAFLTIALAGAGRFSLGSFLSRVFRRSAR